MREADPEDIFGYRLDWMLPKPVPFGYRLMPSDERAGRGRAALRLWLLGFPARTAWGFALSSRLDWREHLPDGYHGRLGDRRLPGEVLRQRLMELVRAEDLKDEGAGKEQPDVLSAL